MIFDGNKAQKNAVEVYAMRICTVTMLFLLFFIGWAIYAVVEYTMPTFIMSGYEYQQYASNDGYCRQTINCFENADMKNPRFSEEVITAKRVAELATMNEGKKHDAVVALLWSAIFTPICFVAWMVHWRIGRKAREEFFNAAKASS